MTTMLILHALQTQRHRNRGATGLLRHGREHRDAVRALAIQRANAAMVRYRLSMWMGKQRLPRDRDGTTLDNVSAIAAILGLHDPQCIRSWRVEDHGRQLVAEIEVPSGGRFFARNEVGVTRLT